MVIRSIRKSIVARSFVVSCDRSLYVHCTVALATTVRRVILVRISSNISRGIRKKFLKDIPGYQVIPSQLHNWSYTPNCRRLSGPNHSQHHNRRLSFCCRCCLLRSSGLHPPEVEIWRQMWPDERVRPEICVAVGYFVIFNFHVNWDGFLEC